MRIMHTLSKTRRSPLEQRPIHYDMANRLLIARVESGHELPRGIHGDIRQVPKRCTLHQLHELVECHEHAQFSTSHNDANDAGLVIRVEVPIHTGRLLALRSLFYTPVQGREVHIVHLGGCAQTQALLFHGSDSFFPHFGRHRVAELVTALLALLSGVHTTARAAGTTHATACGASRGIPIHSSTGVTRGVSSTWAVSAAASVVHFLAAVIGLLFPLAIFPALLILVVAVLLVIIWIGAGLRVPAEATRALELVDPSTGGEIRWDQALAAAARDRAHHEAHVLGRDALFVEELLAQHAEYFGFIVFRHKRARVKRSRRG